MAAQPHLASYDLYFSNEADRLLWFSWLQRLTLVETVPRGNSIFSFHCRGVFLAGGSPAPRQFHSSPAVRGGVQSISLGIIVAQIAIVLRASPRGSVSRIE